MINFLKYHKIQTVFKRPEGKGKNYVLKGQWTMPEFEYLKDNVWEWYEKIDGTNIRVYFEHETGKVHFGGRTDKAIIPEYLLKVLEEIFYPLQDKLAEHFNKDVVLFGEGYGNKIQAVGKLYRKDIGFALFDINVNGIWLKKEDAFAIADDLGLEKVPFVANATLTDMIETIKNGGFKSAYNSELTAEGVVGTPKTYLNDRMGRRIITKLKVKDFESNN
ncbi:MAG: RNA ligase family protein [Bacteroidales bacterium]|nr:RNA ligase family protein [Bacteroidales bacterium]